MDQSLKSGQSSNKGKWLAVTGAVLQLGPVVGLAWTAEGMRRAFAELELEASEGINDPQRLDAAIGDVLVGSIMGLSMGVVGLVLMFVALMGCRYRAQWFFWFLVVYSGLSLLAFPIGTVVGGVFLGYCLRYRHEFLGPKAGDP
ncbi:MAG: hypothetical protein ACKV19_00275 [Verrucomicrobiales bacterium]